MRLLTPLYRQRGVFWLLWIFFAKNIDAIPTAASSPNNDSSVFIENDVLNYSFELEENWLDAEKRPCENFFDFVCGRSLNRSVEAKFLTQQQEVRQRQAQQKKFETFLANENDRELTDAELKMKLFHVSCKEARSLEDLKSTLLYRIVGGWPAVDDTTSLIRKRRNTTWLGVISAFHDAGVEYFFTTHVEIKSNKRVVNLAADSATRLTMRKFEQLASEILHESGVDSGRARLIALEIINFERNRREIAKFQNVSDAEMSEFSYEGFKLELEGIIARTEWDAYFKTTFGKVLKPNDTIYLNGVRKLKQYFKLLQHTTITRFLNWIWIDYLMDKNLTDCQNLTRHYFESVYEHIVKHISIDKAQMATLYKELVQSYDLLLPSTVWIDEMSQQRSKAFFSRVMHQILENKPHLDDEFADLTITRRNFYRNLVKMQNRLIKQRKTRQYQPQQKQFQTVAELGDVFLKEFLRFGDLLKIKSLRMPLNYIVLGKNFATMMIASGGSSSTPGAWRSMDSESEFSMFIDCIGRQMHPADLTKLITFGEDISKTHTNPNNLLLDALADHVTLNSLDAWEVKNPNLLIRINRLLSAGSLQLNFRKLYFISTLLANCNKVGAGGGSSILSTTSRELIGIDAQRHFVHSYLRNSQEFSDAFGCRRGDTLYSQNTCRVLQR